MKPYYLKLNTCSLPIPEALYEKLVNAQVRIESNDQTKENRENGEFTPIPWDASFEIIRNRDNPVVRLDGGLGASGYGSVTVEIPLTAFDLDPPVRIIVDNLPAELLTEDILALEDCDIEVTYENGDPVISEAAKASAAAEADKLNEVITDDLESACEKDGSSLGESLEEHGYEVSGLLLDLADLLENGGQPENAKRIREISTQVNDNERDEKAARRISLEQRLEITQDDIRKTAADIAMPLDGSKLDYEILAGEAKTLVSEAEQLKEIADELVNLS